MMLFKDLKESIIKLKFRIVSTFLFGRSRVFAYTGSTRYFRKIIIIVIFLLTQMRERKRKNNNIFWVANVEPTPLFVILFYFNTSSLLASTILLSKKIKIEREVYRKIKKNI